MRTPTPATARLGSARLGTALAAALLLAGCGGGEAAHAPETSEAANGERIARADVEFASSMLQHHAEALAVIDLTLGKDLPPGLQALVEEMRAQHTADVATLTTRLTDWGEEVPATVRDHVSSGHGHGEPGDDPGEHGEIRAAEGARFTELWVPEMAAALEACAELAEDHDGHHADTDDLAHSIVEDHRAGIRDLEALG